MLKLVAGFALAALLVAVAQAANAAPGVAKGSVNLRTGPGTKYTRIATIPTGAPVSVLRCGRWCEVVYAGRRGWASAAYIARRYPTRVYQQSDCYGATDWKMPGCEWPIERSVREFNRSIWEHRNRQGGGRKR